MVAIGNVDELGGDPDTLAGPAHASVDDGLGSKLTTDLANVAHLLAQRERGGPRDDPKPLDPCERVDQILGEPVREEPVLVVRPDVLEGKHHHGGHHRRLAGSILTPGGHHDQARVVHQDPLLELSDVETGIDAELFAQRAS